MPFFVSVIPAVFIKVASVSIRVGKNKYLLLYKHFTLPTVAQEFSWNCLTDISVISHELKINLPLSLSFDEIFKNIFSESASLKKLTLLPKQMTRSYLSSL